jgi:acid stress-induced BolA-like protein IbaG/YrbA
MAGAQAPSVDDDLIERITAALRTQFPQDTVDVSPGYGKNLHVVVVSRRFDEMSEREKQDMLWSAMDQAELSEAEKTRISLMLAYSPANLK